MAATKKEETLPAVKSSTAVDLPPELLAMMAEDAGDGISTDPEDNLVPLIYVLQAQSPQCNKRSPDYVENACAGAIWLRNSGRPAIDGDTGIIFQPCSFSKDYVEWIPRAKGGGFVERHETIPADAKKVPDLVNPNKTRTVRDNGNEIVEVRYHVGFVLLDGMALPYVIPMSGASHSVSRSWMTNMSQKPGPGGKPLPSYANLYRLRTRERTNAAGAWSQWEVFDAGPVTTAEDYLRGRSLAQAFASGERRAEKAEPEGEVAHENAAM